MALGRLLLVVLMLSLVSLPALALESVAPGEQGVALTDFPIEYFIDGSQTKDYETVRLESFDQTMSTTTLGTRAAVTWYRVSLHNSGSDDRSLFLHLPKAYHVRSIDIVEERSSRVVNRLSVNLNEADAHPAMYRGDA